MTLEQIAWRGAVSTVLYVAGAYYVWSTVPLVFPSTTPGRRALLAVAWPVFAVCAALLNAYASYRHWRYWRSRI